MESDTSKRFPRKRPLLQNTSLVNVAPGHSDPRTTTDSLTCRHRTRAASTIDQKKGHSVEDMGKDFTQATGNSQTSKWPINKWMKTLTFACHQGNAKGTLQRVVWCETLLWEAVLHATCVGRTHRAKPRDAGGHRLSCLPVQSFKNQHQIGTAQSGHLST